MRKQAITVLGAAMIVLSSCGGETATTAADTKATTAETKSSPAKTFIVDSQNSRVGWKGTMLGVYSHTGTLKIEKGTVVVKDGEIQQGKFVVDMASMAATDSNYNPKEGKSKEALIGHLSSPDFFDVANHPKASFKMTGANKGTLTIRGNDEEVELKNVKMVDTKDGMKATATLTFDRRNFGVKYEGSGEAVLSNDVELNIELMLSQS